MHPAHQLRVILISQFVNQAFTTLALGRIYGQKLDIFRPNVVISANQSVSMGRRKTNRRVTGALATGRIGQEHAQHMAKAKKKAAKKGKGQDGANDASSAPDSAAGTGSKLGALLVPLFAFIAAGGASYALSDKSAPEPMTVDPYAAAPVSPSDWSPPKPDKTVAIEPILVSLGQNERVLKLGIALELADGSVQPDTPQLRDAFTSYVRAIGPDSIAEPNFHSQLKRQLLHRARVTLGPDVVTDVLITDFMMTR